MNFSGWQRRVTWRNSRIRVARVTARIWQRDLRTVIRATITRSDGRGVEVIKRGYIDDKNLVRPVEAAADLTNWVVGQTGRFAAAVRSAISPAGKTGGYTGVSRSSSRIGSSAAIRRSG